MFSNACSKRLCSSPKHQSFGLPCGVEDPHSTVKVCHDDLWKLQASTEFCLSQSQRRPPGPKASKKLHGPTSCSCQLRQRAVACSAGYASSKGSPETHRGLAAVKPYEAITIASQ